jgi:hypothetical protein
VRSEFCEVSLNLVLLIVFVNDKTNILTFLFLLDDVYKFY